ncbi:hypothetical protein F4781DRAFT_442217 [Annulohypoxylon bovei var. microspora]|nr:hypothetical protein F4781DRAFT_442217 [Annulohypoxylon bovei var. microspora]
MDLEDAEYQPGDSNSSSDERPSRESPRKRRRRPASPPSAPAFKRQKGVFNPRYLGLLNDDISDAAAGLIAEPPSTSNATAPLVELTHTQLGAVLWTASEKASFFTALARLGRDDLSGISSRIGSKSVLEVHQYLLHLATADRARRADDRKRARGIGPIAMPSAAELSTELMAALDGAADALALRQETYEASLEQKRWGGRWLVTPPLAQVLEHRVRALRRGELDAFSPPHHSHHSSHPNESHDSRSDLPPFAELFHLRTWLKLPDRVFMNSAVEDGNWRFMSEADEPPAIRATALEDFYSLALSITRRLVRAALYVAGSRIRARRAGNPRLKGNDVRTKDVRAAAASVGLKENSREFWAKAARRLRLDVYDDEDYEEEEGDEDGRGSAEEDKGELNEEESQDMDVDTTANDDIYEEEEDTASNIEEQDDQDDDYDYEIMTYAAVEAALGFPNPSTNPAGDPHNLPDTSEHLFRPGFDTDMDPPPSSDYDSLSDTPSIDSPEPQPPDPESSPRIDNALLSADLTEALTYSALDHIPTSRSKQGLLHRLKAEQRLWADADVLDAAVSAAEEARLWGVLRGDPAKPEDESPKPDPGLALGAASSSGRRGLADTGENWRDRTKYYSAWEFRAEQKRLDGYDD